MVHTFSLHGLNLALDVNSGALHILDEPAYYAVKMLSLGSNRSDLKEALAVKYGIETAKQVLREIAELKEKEILFSKRKNIDLKTDGVVKALCLHLAHECNLRCKYCFASEGHYGGTRGLMPLEIAKQAVDFLLQASKGRKHCEIDFFGGEPLLNFPVLQATVAYGKEKATALGKVIKFTVTTNAYQLTPAMIDYLNQENISIVLSLDGRESVHNRFRVTPTGEGSWQQVLKNCKKIVSGRSNDNYYLRGTFTRHNLDFTEDIKVFVKEGFTSFSLEPVVLESDAEEALREEDLPTIFAEYEKLATLLWEWEKKGQRVYFFHFEIDLQHGPCAKKRALGCGAGNAYLAVTPDGSLYPCHQFADEKNFCAGHVSYGVDSNKLARFQIIDSVDKDGCYDCFARFFCGGGCHAAAWKINNDFNKPYALGCELHKKRVECGLYLQARRMLDRINR